jgi:hypothetical protein
MRSLQLRQLNAGLEAYQAARVFQNWVKACVHMCDHLLTAPESELWRSLLPSLHELLGQNQHFVFAKALWGMENQGASGQSLYDSWVDRIRREVRFAKKIGWYWHEGDAAKSPITRGYKRRRADFVYFSPRGIKIVLTPEAIKTVFFPGLPWARPYSGQSWSSEANTVESRRKAPLPRQGRDVEKPKFQGKRKKELPEKEAFVTFRRAQRKVRKDAALLKGRDPNFSNLVENMRQANNYRVWMALIASEKDDEK